VMFVITICLGLVAATLTGASYMMGRGF